LGLISNLSVTSLEPFTTYECAIYASTVVGLGSSPAVRLVTTPEDGMINRNQIFVPLMRKYLVQ